MSRFNQHRVRALLFLFPFLLYEDLILAVLMIAVGYVIIYYENISRQLGRLHWREYLFFVYMFHMLFGERHFAYLGIEPLFVTEIVLGILTVSYAKDLLQVRKVLMVYYLLVLIGLFFAFIYFFQYRIDAIRDSLMLIYAIWVPVIYHVFRKQNLYDLFFTLLKLFIVLKAAAYAYETIMIFLGFKRIVFEGFRFGVGYIVPALIVLSLFLPFRHIGWKYKLLSLMMIPAVFTMFHRSIFMGIALAAVVIFIMGENKTRRAMLAYGITAFAFLFAFLIYYNTQIDVDLFRILDRKASIDEGNVSFRVLSWMYVLDNFYDNFLLGYGVGKPVMYVHGNVFYSTIDVSYFEIRDLGGNAQPHNSYLNVLTRFGILVFPIFLYSLILPVLRFIRFNGLKRRNGLNTYAKALFLSAFLILVYIFAFFNVVLEGPHHAFAFWLAIGMLLSFMRAGNFSPKRIRIKKVADTGI